MEVEHRVLFEFLGGVLSVEVESRVLFEFLDRVLSVEVELRVFYQVAHKVSLDPRYLEDGRNVVLAAQLELTTMCLYLVWFW